MELLLGLLGLGGLAFLLQSKPLPAEKDAIKASEKLDKDPDDPSANMTVGTYLAFVLGKFKEAMPYLAKSSDSTLKNLAEHELQLTFAEDPGKYVQMGNEWVQASKKFSSLVPLFYDRASFWYMQAWPNLKDPDKAKLRIQAQRLAAPRRPGPPRKKLPLGWINDPGVAVIRPTELDNTIARTGAYSAKTFPTKEDVPGYSGLQSIHYPIKGSSYEASVFVRSNETDSQEDSVTLKFYDGQGTHIGGQKKLLPADLPFWHYVSFKGTIPPEAQEAAIMVHQYSKKGNLWVDDASLKFNGIEDLKNGSFEEK